MKKSLMIWILSAVLLLSACTPGVPAITPLPATPTPTYPPPQDAPILPPAAALAVQKVLAEQLGLALDEVAITEVEAVDWPDGCLGLAGPEELCTQAIVPGFRVALTVSGQVYEFRTNRDGSAWRQADASDARRLTERAAALLAEVAGLKLEAIRYLRMEEIQWPNACLGVQEADEMCAEVITPGYKFELENDGHTYLLHANRQLTAGRLGGPAELVAALKVRQVAAQEMNTALVTVRLVSVEMVEWPNSCLGIEKPEMACLMVISPGYRVTLEVGGQSLEYHTNRDASQILRKD